MDGSPFGKLYVGASCGCGANEAYPRSSTIIDCFTREDKIFRDGT